MPTNYIVKSGDCLSSIADAFGFYDYKTIYDHPDNAALKQQRPDPNVLVAGDQVVIPDKTPGALKRDAGSAYTFKVKSRGAKVRVKLKAKYELAYRLEVGDSVFEGTTDGSSPIEHPIPRGARDGKLLAWPSSMDKGARTDDNADVWPLAIGGLDPHDELSGVQGRLRNMALYGGPMDGQMNDATVAALRAYQTQKKLQVTGELDDATKGALRADHD